MERVQPNGKRNSQWVYRPPGQFKRQQVIKSLRPLDFRGDENLELKQVLIYPEQRDFVITLVSNAGSISMLAPPATVRLLGKNLLKAVDTQRPAQVRCPLVND